MTFINLLFRSSSTVQVNPNAEKLVSKATQQQLLCAASVFCISFLCGMANTGPATILELLLQGDSLITITDDDVTQFGTMLLAGRLACSVVCSLLIGKASRRSFLLASLLIQGIGWGLLGTARHLEQLMYCQFILGIGVAFFDIICYTYLAEITSPRNRAILIPISLSTYAAGIEFQFLVELFKNYRILCNVPFAIVIIGTMATYFTLESPYHLVMTKKYDKALQNLSVLYSDRSSSEILNRFEELQRYADEESNGGCFCQFLTKSKRDFGVCLFVFFVNSVIYAGGHWPFLTYGPVIMKHYTNELSTDLVMNLFGSTTLIFSSISTILVDKISRRYLLIYGYGLSAVLQLLLSGLFYKHDTAEDTLAIQPQIIVILMFSLCAVCMLTTYPVVHVLRAEMFPHALKIRGNAVVQIFKLSTSLITHALFFPIAGHFGIGLNYLLYAILASAAMLYVLLYYKETKNLTLTEIRNQYKET